MSGEVTYRGRDPGTGAGVEIAVAEGRIVGRASCDGAGLPWIAPALVDLQVNGLAGKDLNAGGLAEETLRDLAVLLAGSGVGRFLPTLVTAAEGEMLQRLGAIAAACDADPWLARRVAGVHVEGPAISRRDGPRGAHPLAHVRPASIAEFDAWQEASGGRVRIVTLAPEAEGAEDFIRHITAQGVIASIGHSAATPDEVRRAVDAGARMSTHLGNGAAGEMPRHPNLIWTQLADDRLAAGLIADGDHLPDDTLTVMLRAKGLERAFLVSDSVALAGLPPGGYRSDIGGDVEVSDSGKITVAGTPYLAGSGHTLVEILGRVPGATGLNLGQVLALATERPAALLGEEAALAPGTRADLILFDWTPDEARIALREVVLDGEVHTP